VLSPGAFLAALVLSGAALGLLIMCWRHRAVLGLICGAAALTLTIAATLGLLGASSALVGSLLATSIGTVLLMLGRTIERLLDEAPDSPTDGRWE
jgi:hypothetical protein